MRTPNLKFVKATTLVTTLAVLISCSSTMHSPVAKVDSKSAARAPSSAWRLGQISRDLREAVKDYRQLIASDAFNSASCAQQLDAIYDELYLTPPSHFDLDKLHGEALDVVGELWQARLELRKKFTKMADEGSVTSECVDSVRRAFVASRFLEEFIAEWALNSTASSSKTPPEAWSGEFPSVVRAPDVAATDVAATDVRSGDILLSRGDAFTSAAIARVGDVEGQFSHLAMVYIDEKTGKKYTIESHIEIGVVVAPFEKYLTDGKIRSTLFRFKGDPKLAHEAAKHMYERASQANAAGANIPYDFHFDIKDDKEVFCAEVAAIGFRKASQGKIELPSFPSKISAKNREFLDDIGMTVRSTFAPMDIEVDPHFELIAEWRDLTRTHQSHRKDEVLTAMYDWMQRYHYVLDKTAWTKLESDVLWNLRRWPVFSSLLKSKFPVNMAPKTIAATFTISHAAESLFNDLTERDLEQHQKTGLWLTPKQMFDALELLRIDDFSRWKKWQSWQTNSLITSPDMQEREPERPRFHDIFHPVGGIVSGAAEDAPLFRNLADH